MAARRMRMARESDIPALKVLRMAVRENVLGPGRVSDDDYAWFVRHGPVWVCEEQNGIVGFSAGDRRDGTIWALFVDPAWEGRGIGSALLRAACASLAAAKHLSARLETEAGTRAATFYRLQGWTEEGLDSRGQIVFRRRLAGLNGDASIVTPDMRRSPAP